MKREASTSSSAPEKKVNKKKGSGSSGKPGKNDENCWSCFKPFPCERCRRLRVRCDRMHCSLCNTVFHSHCYNLMCRTQGRTRRVGNCPACMLVLNLINY